MSNLLPRSRDNSPSSEDATAGHPPLAYAHSAITRFREGFVA
jgi:hypothetical protein